MGRDNRSNGWQTLMQNGRCLVYTLITLLILICSPYFILKYLENPDVFSISTEEFWRQSKIRHHVNHTSYYYAANDSNTRMVLFPKMVQQTWKTNALPFHETLRWCEACKKMNTEYDFKMFDDEDIFALTAKYYPHYSALLKHLKETKGICKYFILIHFVVAGILLIFPLFCSLIV